MRQIIFDNDHFYHIFNRGIEKRPIFKTDDDYLRFVHDLLEFNNEEPTENFGYQLYRTRRTIKELIEKVRKPLVDIICFCLMPSHFHLVLKQLKEGGTSKFMQKLGAGYTRYFNIKHEREGVLFQGAFKVVPIETDAQFLHISRYIHLNPVELIEPGWKEKGIDNWERIKKFLKFYHWSSYSDYVGRKQYDYLIKPEPILGQFKDFQEYENFVKSWTAKDAVELNNFIVPEARYRASGTIKNTI